MKQYLNFQFLGRKFFPVWIVYYLVAVIPYFYFSYKSEEMTLFGPAVSAGSGFLFNILTLIFYFYLVKMCIDSLEYQGELHRFSGEFSQYLIKVVVGFLLSMITLGIYIPWFVKSLMDFFVNNTSYKEECYNFKGKASRLLVIFLLAFLVPLIVAVFIIYAITEGGFLESEALLISVLSFILVIFLLIPYIFYLYKWMIDLSYQDYQMRWTSSFGGFVGMFLMQLLLSVVTLGIYVPMAYLKVYRYVINGTVVDNGTSRYNFGYDLEAGRDFLFLWGQLLLLLITLGLYYPWAVEKIGKRVMGKTYLMGAEEIKTL